MLSVNGQQFSPEKVLFLPRPTRVFKLFVWLVKSRLNPRWISGESHLNLKMSYLFLCSILTLFAGYSQPINKNRYKKSEVILNLFQGYSKLILNLFQKVLFIFGMKWQFVATWLTAHWHLFDKKCNFKTWAVPTLFPKIGGQKLIFFLLFDDRLYELVMKSDSVQTLSERSWAVLNLARELYPFEKRTSLRRYQSVSRVLCVRKKSDVLPLASIASV